MATAAKKTAKSTAKKKPAARKAPAKKAAKKVAARKPASKAKKAKQSDLKGRVEELLEQMKGRASDAQERGEKAGLAYLGLYGKAYDFAREQYAKASDRREEQVEELVKRGETVRKQAQKRIDDAELPSVDFEVMKEKIQDQVDAMKESGEEMRGKLNDSIESIKEKVAPAKA